MKLTDLLRVERPPRYMGGEMASVRKDTAEIRFVLAFPDVYEVGMSHLGLQILYKIINDLPWAAAERAYTPWPDMEECLRKEGQPLTSLETGTPLHATDIIGFTLQYELSYTNILAMLELGGIPFFSAERDATHPVIIAGGPCAYNPEPLADLFDAFLLGDGEEAVVEIAETVRQWKKTGKPKLDLLHALAAIPGVYVPAFFSVSYDEKGVLKEIVPLKEGYSRVRRRFATNLSAAPYPTSPVIPFLKTVHDRVSTEIARGCTRGCRFCQAGYIYRPVRERSPDRILGVIEEVLGNTGYDEVSLLSLSTGDYGCISDLLKEVMARYADDKVAISLPSLRVGTLTGELVEEIKRVRKTGFTLAPEAGSEKLRQVMNKGISEEDLLSSAREIYGNGWRLIKLYFMLGLPTETEEDLLAIAELSKQVKRQGRLAGTGGEVNVSVSSFVPKAHTPFQWEAQIGVDEIWKRQQFIRLELKKRKLNFKWQDAPLSFMEGVFARGDRRLAAALVKAFQLGCRFDGWREHFNMNKWEQAFQETGLDADSYLRKRDLDEILPWDHLDCGVTREYLLTEREKAFALLPTADCRTGCTGCGVCDFTTVKMELQESKPSPKPRLAQEPGPAAKIRFRFTKAGRMSLLSHLEMINLFTRAVRRAGIPIKYSQGFHPHPRFSFATALSVGIESHAEYMDLDIAAGFGADLLKERLNAVLPEGISVLESTEVPLNAPSLSVIMESVRYRVTLPHGENDLTEAVERFLQRDSFVLRREKKGKKDMEIDLRAELRDLKADGNVLEMVIGRGKPIEFTAAITGLAPELLADSSIEKLEVIFKD